jgi:membrane protein DedA with SNARE-associated domain
LGFLAALVSQYVQQFTYLGMLGVLILCGFGLPIPEEVTFLAAGYLIFIGLTEYWLTMGVCMVGVMVGDTTMFLLGKWWGGELLGHPIMRKFITEAKMQKVRARFAEHSIKAVFVCRFLVGARAAGFFTAGSLGMKLRTFFLVDLLAAMISVPLFVHISYHFADRIDVAAKWVRNINICAAAVAAAAIVVIILLAWKYRKAHRTTS